MERRRRHRSGRLGRRRCRDRLQGLLVLRLKLLVLRRGAASIRSKDQRLPLDLLRAVTQSGRLQLGLQRRDSRRVLEQAAARTQSGPGMAVPMLPRRPGT